MKGDGATSGAAEDPGSGPREVSLQLRGHRWRFACDDAGLAALLERVAAMGVDERMPLGRFGSALVRHQLCQAESLGSGLHKPTWMWAMEPAGRTDVNAGGFSDDEGAAGKP